jgi:replicative DNA helicase
MREQTVSGNTDNLPYSLEFEKSVLGAILIDNDALVKIADSLGVEDFYDAQHQLIYQAILDLYEDSKPIDILTLSNQLKANNSLDRAGGAGYLTELTNFVPTAARVETYANVVSEKALRRRLNHVNKELAVLMLDETKGLNDLIEEAETQIFKLSQRHIKENIVSLEEILGQSFERLDELHNNKDKIRGVPTGYKDLDDMLAGLQRSDLFVLAARPSMGKTAFVLNLAHKIATLAKEPIVIFSLEMSKEQLVDRLLSMESGVDGWALRTGNLTDDDFERLGNAMGTLGEAPIYIDDSPSITIAELRTKAKREAHKRPLGLIIVDYLQLMSGGPRFSGQSNRVQEISEISRGLKAIARELNVPLIALSQLSRSVESRSPQIPQLADLRESGSIEQDADVVAFLYREEYYNPETDKKNIMEVLIKKHRNGPTGNVELYFERDKQRIRSLDSKHSNPFEG